MPVETKRLLLRELTLADLAAMTRLWTDPDVAAFMDDFGPRTAAEVQSWLPAAIAAHDDNPRYRGWAAVLRATGEVVGWLSLGGSSRPVGEIDFAYIIDRAHRGHGLASEALRGAIAFCFEVLEAESFWGECHVANDASAAAMRKAGMHYVGTVDGQQRFLIEKKPSSTQDVPRLRFSGAPSAVTGPS